MEAFLSGVGSWHIEQGHVLSVLSRIPDNSIDCTVTSPPYFGLRNYGTEPQIWGGDVNCSNGQHKFGTIKSPGYRANDASPGIISGRVNGENTNAQYRTSLISSVCYDCGAWRGELGLEDTPERFVSHLVEIFSSVYRVLRPWGQLWINIADSSNGSGGSGGDYLPGRRKAGREDAVGPRRVDGLKQKDLVGVPWLLALALRNSGWYLRNAIIWDKGAGLPESVRDRCTRSHEYIFHFAKSPRYYYDLYASGEDIIDENGMATVRNERSVWRIGRSNYRDGEHHATYPIALPKKCIELSTSPWGTCCCHEKPVERNVQRLAGWGKKGFWSKRYPTNAPQAGHLLDETGQVMAAPAIVLDPFCGAASTGRAALDVGRRFLGIELKEEFVGYGQRRLRPRLEGWETSHSGPAITEHQEELAI